MTGDATVPLVEVGACRANYQIRKRRRAVTCAVLCVSCKSHVCDFSGGVSKRGRLFIDMRVILSVLDNSMQYLLPLLVGAVELSNMTTYMYRYRYGSITIGAYRACRILRQDLVHDQIPPALHRFCILLLHLLLQPQDTTAAISTRYMLKHQNQSLAGRHR